MEGLLFPVVGYSDFMPPIVLKPKVSATICTMNSPHMLMYRRNGCDLTERVYGSISPALLLWRERKRHQNPDLGHTDSKTAAVAAPKFDRAEQELLSKNCPYALSEPAYLLQPASCRPGNHVGRST